MADSSVSKEYNSAMKFCVVMGEVGADRRILADEYGDGRQLRKQGITCGIFNFGRS